MNAFQKYVFRQILGPLGAILAALTMIAMLTQGLNQLDILVDQRTSALTFLWVTLLAMPQVLSLILPIALFFAVLYTINRMQGDSELVVAFAAGVSRWQVAAPVFRVAVVAALAHLASNVLLQPASYREMRQTLYEVRGDLAASLVRDGAFTTPAGGLTLYSRSTDGRGEMRDLFVEDSRDSKRVMIYTARRGAAAMIEGRPAMIMREGQIMQPQADGAVNLLDFDQYVLELGDFMGAPDAVVLKSSDRFLSELFYPNLVNFFDQRNADKFIAEGHARLAAPLLNMALAMIALAALMTGDFNRRGYGGRMAVGAALALLVRLLALGVQSAARDSLALNAAQYALPLAVTAAAFAAMMWPRRAAKMSDGPSEGARALEVAPAAA